MPLCDFHARKTVKLNKIICMEDIIKNKMQNKVSEKKLGLALGSGGARGMAHVGIIRAFEEEKIKFDVVTGSSIGAIVGGLYASGVSTSVMHAFIKEFGINDMRKLLTYKLRGGNLQKLLSSITGDGDIEDLLIPYGAVAVNLDFGNQEWIIGGNLAVAMRASSAILPFFKAVKIGRKRLVDDGYLNAIPSDFARRLGATVVVGVSLTSGKNSNARIKIPLDKVYKNNRVPVADRTVAGYKFSDVLLEPEVENYGVADFRNFDKLEEIGYLHAKRNMKKIKQLLS